MLRRAKNRIEANDAVELPPPGPPIRYRRTWPQRFVLLVGVVLITGCLYGAWYIRDIKETFGDIPRLLTERETRKRIISKVTNREVREFWTNEYERYSPRFRSVVIAPLQNKVGALLADPLLRRILTGPKSSFNFRRLMDEGKILVVNLSKGQIGEGPAALLGSLLVSSLSLAGLSRANVAEEKRRDFYVYLDEFHTFSTLTLATMLSELRKYRVSLVLAHQYLGQLETEVADAVIGNAGTIICFRVGAKDAPLLAAELAPKFEPEDLVNLPNYNIYLRLMIDGQVSKPFSAETVASAHDLCA